MNGYVQAKHGEVRSLILALVQKLHEATQLSDIDPMNACSTNKSKSIFQAKREAAEQQRLMRLAYKNQALVGRFILLVDLILTTRLAKASLNISDRSAYIRSTNKYSRSPQLCLQRTLPKIQLIRAMGKAEVLIPVAGSHQSGNHYSRSCRERGNLH